MQKAILICLCLFLSACQLIPQSVEDKSVVVIGTNMLKTECKKQAGGIYSWRDGFRSVLKPKRKRCELATSPFTIPKEFTVKFNFIIKTMPQKDGQWFSLFQVHSFPDKHLNERWRCPILALEVLDSELRMFSRWDEHEKSTLRRGTCANDENSIGDRLLFKGVAIRPMEPVSFELQMRASYKDDGYIRVSVNGEEVANIIGATAFNDRKGPYIKYGIYKPTSWADKTTIEVEYKDIEFIQE